MARCLPWKRASETAPSASSSSTSSSRKTPRAESPRARASKSTPQNVLRTPLSRRHERAFGSDAIRSPSTSPPPERPQEGFMIPGPLDDDRYRMVEDEFLRIAQRFTAHLHRAEYDRLKALAKSQNAATIREIERPVVAGLTSTLDARRRREAVKRVAEQRKALQDSGAGAGRDAGGDELPLPAPWTGTSLQGLMEVPSRESKTIMPFTNPAAATSLSSSSSFSSSKTRAAAGFHAGVLSSSPPPPRQPERPAASTSSASARESSSKRIKLEIPSSSSPFRRSHETPRPARTQHTTIAPFQTPTHSRPRQPVSSSSSVRKMPFKRFQHNQAQPTALRLLRRSEVCQAKGELF